MSFDVLEAAARAVSPAQRLSSKKAGVPTHAIMRVISGSSVIRITYERFVYKAVIQAPICDQF